MTCHCLATALPLPFLDFPLPFHCLALAFHCLATAFRYAYQDTVAFGLFACLYVGSMIQLTARLLLLCAFISLQSEDARTLNGSLGVCLYFLVSFLLTMGFTNLFNWLGLYSGGKTMAAMPSAGAEYRITLLMIANDRFLSSESARSRIRATVHYEVIDLENHETESGCESTEPKYTEKQVEVDVGWKTSKSRSRVGIVHMSSHAAGPATHAKSNRKLTKVTLTRSWIAEDLDMDGVASSDELRGEKGVTHSENEPVYVTSASVELTDRSSGDRLDRQVFISETGLLELPENVDHPDSPGVSSAQQLQL